MLLGDSSLFFIWSLLIYIQHDTVTTLSRAARNFRLMIPIFPTPWGRSRLPAPGPVPVPGFRAALRAAFSYTVGELNANEDTPVNGPGRLLPPWQGLAATPCAWDEASEDFDVVSGMLGSWCLYRLIWGGLSVSSTRWWWQVGITWQ